MFRISIKFREIIEFLFLAGLSSAARIAPWSGNYGIHFGEKKETLIWSRKKEEDWSWKTVG
jgi:hypothetical protein